MNRFTIKVAVYILLIKDNSILLSKRSNTGWMDGNYGVPAGHLENNEEVTEALIREIAEEINIKLPPETIKFAHVMHRKSNYIDFYFTVEDWVGEPVNNEPEKCSEVRWFPLDNLPENMIPSVRRAIENYKSGIQFSEHESEG